MMKNFKEFSKEVVVNEGEVIKSSYYFNKKPSTSSNIDRSEFQIWLNGGNAFSIKVDPTLLKKLKDQGVDTVTEVEHKLMELVVKTLGDNIEKVINETIK
jgi:hypothetical protein